MKKLLKQVGLFLIVSGTGWIIDFGIYLCLVHLLKLSVSCANMISAIPSITFVFMVSTRKIFSNDRSKVPLTLKYIIYFIYQVLLISSVSLVVGLLYNSLARTILMQYAFIVNLLPLICKILITPVTMVCNFIVLKLLSEKL